MSELEGAYFSIPAEKAAAEAQKHGLIVHWGNPHTLTIDLDDGAPLNMAVLALMIEKWNATIKRRYVSRSGNGIHTIIKLNEEFTVPERLMLEVAIGSDAKRAVLALADWRAARAEGVEPEPCVLFEPRTSSVIEAETTESEEVPF